MTAWTSGSLLLSQDSDVALRRWARAVLHCLGVEIETSGVLQTRFPLWVSNHLSWLDPLVLLSFRSMRVLAKQDVTRYPFIGQAAKRAGLIFVDRQDATSRAYAVVRLFADLRRGKPILLFPEGTTTTGERLAPLQEGGLRVAYRCGAAIQPIRLSCDDPVYPWIAEDSLLPHLAKVARSGQTRVHLQAGHVLEPRHFETEDNWIEAIRLQLVPTPRGLLEL